MNKRVMALLFFVNLLIPVGSQAETVTWKQKVKNVVSVVCNNMPSKKSCLIPLSTIGATTVVVAGLLKYTNLWHLICNKVVKTAVEDTVVKELGDGITSHPVDTSNPIAEAPLNNNSTEKESFTEKVVNEIIEIIALCD